MTYNELLAQPEWKDRCNEILQRDKFICQGCKKKGYHNDNFMILDNLTELDKYFGANFFNSRPPSEYLTMDLSKYMDDEFSNIETRHIADYKELSVYGFVLLKSKANNKIFNNILNTPRGLRLVTKSKNLSQLECTAYCDAEHNCVNGYNTINYCSIIKFNKKISDKCIVLVGMSSNFSIEVENGGFLNNVTTKYNIIYEDRLFHVERVVEPENNKGLNIHHTYYIRGLKPWQYDNKCLITLCEDCHQKRHQSPVVIYDSIEKRTYHNALTCDRCGGSGYLPQYSHVEHGICFKCSGEGVIINS